MPRCIWGAESLRARLVSGATMSAEESRPSGTAYRPMNDQLQSGSRVVRFGVFELDTQSRELRKGGARLNLQEQPLQILECLLEHPGELINRDELCKRLWPGGTFVDFEHGLNAAIKRLRDVLGDSADSPRFVETVPRRGYRFLAPVERSANGASERLAPLVVRHNRRRLAWSGAAAILTILAGGALAMKLLQARPAVVAPRTTSPVHSRPAQLSTLSGWSNWPSFSPDGGQVAFSRSKEGHHNSPSSVYVQLVGSSESRQLMTDATDDYGPSWSPDGQRIAFVRRSPAGDRIHLTTPLGGSAVKLSDFAAAPPISWSPDGRYLAVRHAAASSGEESAIWLVPVDGGDPRRLTRATPPTVNKSPSFSPDGHRLAYASCTNGACYLEVIALTSELTPSVGPATHFAATHHDISGIAWTADGQSLVFDGYARGPRSQLYRAPADGSQSPSALEDSGFSDQAPATMRTRETLAFARGTYNVDVYRFETGGPVRGVVTSSLNDWGPQFSPNGTQIVFCTDRTGADEIWVAAADGTGAHRLTQGPNRVLGSPHWAPDGRSIVFDSQAPDGAWHVWSIDSDGGTPRQITRGPGTQNIPWWSHDGRWVYFSADRGRGHDIWRVNVRDGTEQQITRAGAGMLAVEAVDGLSLFYQPRDGDSPLLAMPLTGGAGKQLVACVHRGKFAATPRGIYYVACDFGPDLKVRVLDPRTGADRVIGSLDRPALGIYGLSVSADGKAVLYSRVSSFSADIMLIEKFK